MVNRSLTLSARLILALAGGLLALGLMIGLAAHQGIAQILDSALNDKARSLARQLSIVATDALLVYDYGTLERYAVDLVDTPNLRYLEVRGATGEIYAQAGEENRSEDGHVVRVTEPIVAADALLGEVTLDYDRSSIPATLNRLMSWSIGGLIALLAVMFWLMRRTMDRRIVQPIQQLAESYNPLRGQACPENPDLPDELARLSKTFARLCREVQEHLVARQESEEIAQAALERLLHEQRLATVGQMAAGLAHSLNTPLGNILGYTQLEMRDTDEKTHARLVIIEQQTRQCRDIVNNLLTTVRAPEPNLHSVDVSDVISNTISLTTPVLRQRGLQNIQVTSDDAATALADPSGLEHILFNLLTNAVQAGAKNLYLQVKSRDEKIWISLTDNGQGISPSVQARLFEPFVTTKKPGQGTGLGLYLAKTLASAMQGDISVTSTDQTGTTFTIELKRYPENTAP